MLIYTRQRVDVEGQTELLSTGIYEDEVVRTNEGWRFLRRRYGLQEPLSDDYFA
jgi:hypothetical protein